VFRPTSPSTVLRSDQYSPCRVTAICKESRLSAGHDDAPEVYYHGKSLLKCMTNAVTVLCVVGTFVCQSGDLTRSRRDRSKPFSLQSLYAIPASRYKSHHCPVSALRSRDPYSYPSSSTSNLRPHAETALQVSCPIASMSKITICR